jgi:DinB family
LRAEREKTDRQILDWIKHLDANWLNQPFEYTSNVDGQRRVLPAWILVTHLFNHQTHHRGQVTTSIEQLGYDPGVTDIPWLPTTNAVIYPCNFLSTLRNSFTIGEDSSCRHAKASFSVGKSPTKGL